MTGGAAVFAGLVVLFFWHRHRIRARLPTRRSDYVWAFLYGGIAYVMLVLLITHNILKFTYAQILDQGFGEPQINIAFMGALYEAVAALWDLWNGNSYPPGHDVI